MQSFYWMFQPNGQFEFDMDQYPLAQFALNFYYSETLSPIQIPSQTLQNDVKIGSIELKPIKQQGNPVGDLNNDMTMQNSVKLEGKVQKDSKIQKIKTSNFKYFDPHEAPALTFGVDDIDLISQMEGISSQQNDKNFPQNNNPIQIRSNSPQRTDNYFRQMEFCVKQPDPNYSPFLIIKKKSIVKKKLFSEEEFQKRAHMIEINRLKNIHKMEIEERIGKKLPVKNKKWKRKKQSLVFNSQQYKKKLITSKKYKDSSKNYDKLFFSVS